jgi:hypothetical protein
MQPTRLRHGEADELAHGGPMPEYKGAIEVTFTADDDAEADVHLLERANYLEKASLVLSAIGRTIERI